MKKHQSIDEWDSDWEYPRINIWDSRINSIIESNNAHWVQGAPFVEDMNNGYLYVIEGFKKVNDNG